MRVIWNSHNQPIHSVKPDQNYANSHLKISSPTRTIPNPHTKRPSQNEYLHSHEERLAFDVCEAIVHVPCRILRSVATLKNKKMVEHPTRPSVLLVTVQNNVGNLGLDLLLQVRGEVLNVAPVVRHLLREGAE